MQAAVFIHMIRNTSGINQEIFYLIPAIAAGEPILLFTSDAGFCSFRDTGVSLDLTTGSKGIYALEDAGLVNTF